MIGFFKKSNPELDQPISNSFIITLERDSKRRQRTVFVGLLVLIVLISVGTLAGIQSVSDMTGYLPQVFEGKALLSAKERNAARNSTGATPDPIASSGDSPTGMPKIGADGPVAIQVLVMPPRPPKREARATQAADDLTVLSPQQKVTALEPEATP